MNLLTALNYKIVECHDLGKVTFKMASVVGFNSLADEILVHIFSFLLSVDLIQVAKVCERFSKICCEKKVVRCKQRRIKIVWFDHSVSIVGLDEINYLKNESTFTESWIFDRMVSDSYIKFSKEYGLDPVSLKGFLQPKIRCLNIVDVDLNHCYWLLAAHLNFLVKLKNLRGLHLLDCHVSLKSFCRIVNSYQLENVSWTWDSSVVDGDLTTKCSTTLTQALCKLHTLHIQLNNPFELTRICFLLQCCKEIKYLTVSENTAGISELIPLLTSRSYKFELPQLERCKFLLQCSNGVSVDRFIYEVMTAAFPCGDKPVNGFWTTAGGCLTLRKLTEEKRLNWKQLRNVEFLSLDGTRDQHMSIIRIDNNATYASFTKQVLGLQKLPNCKQVSLNLQRLDEEMLTSVAEHCPGLELLSLEDCRMKGDMNSILGGLTIITMTCRYLSVVNLSGTHIHILEENPCRFLSNLKVLRSLSLPACMVSSKPTSQPQGQSGSDAGASFLPKRRQGVVLSSPSEEVIQRSRLYCVTSGCPDVEFLTIRGNATNVNCSGSWNWVCDDDLLCISSWLNLRKLVIKDVHKLHGGSFLLKICKYCPNLQHLSLTDVGPKGFFSYGRTLVNALKYCCHLKDLRVEQLYDVKLSNLAPGILNCQQLERLCIISEKGTTFEAQEVMQLVEKLNKLVALYLIFPLTSAACKRLTITLEKRFVPHRPAFNTVIANSLNHLAMERTKIPHCHFHEIAFPFH